jgi:RNA polymerase sigma-70 factor (ECF subfamily)
MLDWSDDELVSAISRGEVSAGEILYTRHGHYVYGTMYTRTAHPQNAEDLAQEVWIKALRAIDSGTYQPRGKFREWLNMIIRSVHIDWIRRERRFVLLDQDETDGEPLTARIPDAAPLPDEEILMGEQRDVVRQVLEIVGQSSDPEIKICLLHDRDGYSYEEIQAKFDLNTPLAAKMKAFRGRHKIREHFQKFSRDYFR